MPQKKKINFKKELEGLLYIVFAILILFLSAFNLQPKKITELTVLGATTDNSYWEEMLEKNPTYRDGWVELGRIDKVKEIDPNYFKP